MNKRIISLLLAMVMLLGLAACGSSAPAATEATADVAMQYITPEDAKAKLDDSGYVFFDLRKAEDSSKTTVPGAQAWDMDAAKEGDAEAGKATMTKATQGLDKNIVLICYSGKRYAQAATNALSAIGYDMSKVYTLEGGFKAWSEKFPDLCVAPEAAAQPEAQPEAAKEVPEVSTVRWNWGTSANILVALAIEKGYFAEYGLNIEFVNANENANAMTLLSTGQVDVVSNSGTASPLQNIAAGVDMTIFGGHMVQGCMPVVARKGTEWKGIESLVGKKFACNPSYFAFTGALMDAGYDKPLEAVDFISGMGYNDALAALQRGEFDYALMGTGQNFAVNNMDDIEILTYQGDVMPDYSCCRMECPTVFLEKNPITVKCILKALIRAQAYYEANKEECVDILAKAINADHDYVAAYMLNDHYKVHADPLAKSVVRAWNILDKTGFLDENAKNIDINDHINTELYKQALDACAAEYGAEDPAFYQAMNEYFAANN